MGKMSQMGEKVARAAQDMAPDGSMPIVRNFPIRDNSGAIRFLTLRRFSGVMNYDAS